MSFYFCGLTYLKKIIIYFFRCFWCYWWVIFFLRKNFLYFYFLCFMFFMNLYLVRIGNSYFLLDETDLDDIYPLFTDNSETQRQNSSRQKLASFLKSFFLFQFFNNCRVKFFVCYYFLEVAVHFQYKQSTILF